MKYIFGIAIVVAAIMAGWRMYEPEFTDILFQDDLRDTAAQLSGARACHRQMQTTIFATL
jgi:hypothetical protein